MNRKEFLEELKDFINENRKTINNIECSNHSDQVDIDKMNNIKQMLDKLEQDYFHLPVDMSFENVKKFDEDGNLIKKDNSLKEQLQEKIGELYPTQEKEKGTIEQVEEGLLKIFNELIESGEYSIGNYDFDNEEDCKVWLQTHVD